ncbi:MAG TPA: right-handed parallel beta-helix repeat-containing protein, partial [Chloroflexi bacterium]|nr:right-handed parallel beta-helix repeat-containing protein [Chloroflexota bacterium]
GIVLTEGAANNRIEGNYIGTDADGNFQSGLGNGDGLGGNDEGVFIREGAHNNVITDNIIGGNTRSGVWLTDGSYNNIISGNWIGTNPDGDDVKNLQYGIRIKDGAYGNRVSDNVIGYNYRFGIYISGEATKDNVIENNEIANNGGLCEAAPSQLCAGVLLWRTHITTENSLPSSTGGFDNSFIGNVISGNAKLGIYNIGASPLISANQIVNNGTYGIFNVPDYGSDASPSTAHDDILSIPYVMANSISGHPTGIRSLDTAPAFRRSLHLSNTVTATVNQVEQVWFGAVEVLTGSITSPVPISDGISVILYSQETLRRYSLNYYSPGDYDSGIWGIYPDITYTNVISWVAIEEFEVDTSGSILNHDPYAVVVKDADTGKTLGSIVFSFDAISHTHFISPDAKIPFYIATGPYHRYQVAEVNLAYLLQYPPGSGGGTTADSDDDDTPDYIDVDSDGDGIPDSVEGTGDVDDDDIPNYLDLDSDGDGIPDSVEGADDSDGDGAPDFLDPDDDGDGIPTAEECPGGPPCQDSDGDGTPDYLDRDSDGDGIPDWEVAGCSDDDYDCRADEGSCPENFPDTDGDGVLNYLDDDSDADGIPDCVEHNPITDCIEAATISCPMDVPCTNLTLDSDKDGTPNCQDDDVDGDGTPNYLDTDSDEDGIPDEMEGVRDCDGDGVPNFRDPGTCVYLPLIIRTLSVTQERLYLPVIVKASP